MATYIVTTSNWNDPAFWSAISESGPGHTLDFSALPSNYVLDFWPGADRIVISDGTTSFTIGDSDFGGSRDATLGGTTQVEHFTTVIGPQGNDFIDGSNGNDTLSGEGGNDVLTGHDGDDNISGGDGADQLYGGFGNDTISGGAGDDLIQGEQGNDSISGGAGDDTINVSDFANTDTIDGGESAGDSDELNFFSTAPVVLTFTDLENGSYSYSGGGGASGSFANIEHFGGGSGNDTLDFSAHGSEITVTYTGSASGSITDGADTITFSNIEQIILTEQADVVDATDDSFGVDIDGAGGDDTLEGGAGNDTILGGADNDSILASAGNDLIDGGDGDDFFDDDTVASGNDTIFGGAGNDTIQHDTDTHIVNGGIGDDYIANIENTSSSKITTITGGDGTDTYALDNTEGGLFSSAHVVDLSTGFVTFSGANRDVISEFENVEITDSDAGAIGDAGNNKITGVGTGNNTFDGGAGNDTIEGGAGNDTLTGGAGNDVFVYSAGDGNDTITDFNTGNTGTLADGDNTNNDFIDLSGFYDNLSELYADQADDGILNQSNTLDGKGRTVDYSDNTDMGAGSLTFSGANADNSSFTFENTGVVCFTEGTAILTPRGDVLIEDLKVGDLVITADNGPQPIRWIGKRTLHCRELAAAPNLRPVLIKAHVLNNERALLVSPQHCMLLGQDKLVRAKHLAETRAGIRIAHGKKSVCYIHLMFDAHQIIFAENSPSESFYPGPQSLQMIISKRRNELFSLFPELGKDPSSRHAIASTYGPTAREVAKRRELLKV